MGSNITNLFATWVVSCILVSSVEGFIAPRCAARSGTVLVTPFAKGQRRRLQSTIVLQNTISSFEDMESFILSLVQETTDESRRKGLSQVFQENVRFAASSPPTASLSKTAFALAILDIE